MARIANVRTVLLSSPYASADDPEIKTAYPSGPKRTVGMVEITLEDGTVGLGEGYLAVFAPLVFKAIVDLCTPYMIGADGLDIERRVRDLRSICDYWSMEGAARHVVSAFEIALQDARARRLEVPVYDMLGGAHHDRLTIYGSGGSCDTREAFRRELDLLSDKGIGLYKIRASRHDVMRTAWVMEEAGRRGIGVAVDMCQNLADPPQSVDDVVEFIDRVHAETGRQLVFVEEALGPEDTAGFKALRERIGVHVYGGEIITTPRQMIERINDGLYDAVQPDASVIGGISAVLDIFAAARPAHVGVVVHAWGGAAAVMASYHAAFAAGGMLVEYPMPDFPLAAEMLGDQAVIEEGHLLRPTAPGLGITLTPEIEARYPFDESAVYSCMPTGWEPATDETWRI